MATNPSYDPLPLTHDDNIGQALYNAPRDNRPPSPGVNTPMMGGADFPDDDLPAGAARPRFLGHAAYSDAPELRHSIAGSQHSSQPSMDHHSEYNSSVYGLNDPSAAPPPLSHGFYSGGYRDDPSHSQPYLPEMGMPMSSMGKSRHLDEKRAIYAAPRSKRTCIIISVVVCAILLIAAVMIPLYFAVIRPKMNSDDDNSTSDKATSTKTPNDKPVTAAVVTGGDGSKVTTSSGETFTYANSFGGSWYWDENDPFNNGAKAQSWSPALNETFKYGIDKIRGVNLGGWLTLEPFICPGVFEPFLNNKPPAVDEWTLHELMAANGGFAPLEEHYKTFITEKDFAEIAGAGLNWVRIPLPYWAIETRPGEPYHGKVAWDYFLKAIQWARKYGIRINLDLHAMAGSQNGWNHSGRLGSMNILRGPMGFANAQRGLDHIRILTEFISQPQYKDVVPMFGIMNEPQGAQDAGLGKDSTFSFNVEAYRMIRQITGVGEGKGPWISYHDAFFTRDEFAGFMPDADRIILDSHPYLCFGPQTDAPMSSYITTPCERWGGAVNASMAAFGLTTAGEFSNAVTDCGLWVTGVNEGTRYEGTYTLEKHERTGSCDQWTDYQKWTPAFKADMKKFALHSMDALQDYFFWTWKIGESIRTKKVESPQWSYQLGLKEGWMPKDPREAVGACGNTSPWTPPLKAGTGNIPASVTAQYPWPPAAIRVGGAPADLPAYTPTGAVPTLPGPTFSFASATAKPDAGNGWFSAADTAGLMVEKQGCQYLDPWIGDASPPPVCPT